MPRTIKGKYVTEAAQVFQNGDDFWHAGQYDEARDAYKKSAVLYKNKDDTEGEAFALMRLGELELSIGHHKEAESALLKAVELTKDFDFSQNTYGEILINLAKVELAKNDVLKANYYLKKATEKRNKYAPKMLGDCYYDGIGVPIDSCLRIVPMLPNQESMLHDRKVLSPHRPERQMMP